MNIPDAALRTVIEARLGKSPGATITTADMEKLTELAPSNNPNISDLTGLEHAINLTKLRLTRSDQGQVSNLSAVASLTKLEQLFLTNYLISDITPLANLTALKNLHLSDNSITHLQALSKLTALVHLILTDNAITDISGVSGLKNLRHLDLAQNRALSDISPLTKLKNLEILRLDSTSITGTSLSAVLPSFSTEIDQQPIEQYPKYFIFSGGLGLTNTAISDLSVLDGLPEVFFTDVYLQYMGTVSNGTLFFHLMDLTPLVDLMNKGKFINSKTALNLQWNFGFDYESLYEDLPALVAGSRSVGYVTPAPTLEREFPAEASYRGHPGTRYTFKVRGVNEHPNFPAGWRSFTPRTMQDGGDNRQFAQVPVTWIVTAPDGTERRTQTLTGLDGLASVSVTLGAHGETHTVEAVVPAKMTSVDILQHPELRVSFTATADRTVPPPPPPRASGQVLVVAAEVVSL